MFNLKCSLTVASLLLVLYSIGIEAQDQQDEELFNSVNSGFVDTFCASPDYHEDFSNHDCDRECVEGENPRLCYYHLSLVNYEAHSPEACADDCDMNNICFKCIKTDGVNSLLQVSNYKFPGPPIVVCHNDRIIVDVTNHLLDTINVTNREEQASKDGEPTTYHWHGILQKQVIFQDGVPGVTQQAIPSGSVYRYKFQADNVGTLFAHSHWEEQRGFGLAGPLIVKQPNDPNAALYDYDLTEHIVFIQDIGYNFVRDAPDTILINGQGVQQNAEAGDPHVFMVEPNMRYRFRVVFNGIINIRLSLWIKEMKMTLIAMDGHPIEPREFGSLVMASAERMDFILTTGEYRDEPYWMHVRADGRANQTNIAMIKFKDAPMVQWTREEFEDNTPPEDAQLAWSTFYTISDPDLAISSNKMLSINDMPSNLQAETCEQIFINQAVRDQGFQINNITMSFPDISFQDQVSRDGVQLDESDFCTIESLGEETCLTEVCQCQQVLKVSVNTCYELVVMGPHPFHLHGHVFHVVAEGVVDVNVNMTRESFLDLEAQNLVERNLKNPPIRDVSMPPGNGYVVLRVFFDNLGFNAAHCHIEPHSISGMFIVFQVGTEEEIRQLPHSTHIFEPSDENQCSNQLQYG